MSPLDVISPASTGIAAASGSSTFVLLLRPATIHSVPHLATIRALVGLTLGAECLACIFSLHRSRCSRPLFSLTLGVLIRQHPHHILGTKLSTAHFHVEHHILVALGKTKQQTDCNVLVLHLRTDSAKLGGDVEDLVAVVHDVRAFSHLCAEKLSLEVDASCLLRPTVERLQACPRNPRFLAVVEHMMIVRTHV